MSTIHEQQRPKTIFRDTVFRSILIYDHELDVDIRKNQLLKDYFRQTYAAEWITNRNEAIVLVQIDHEPTEYEMQVYHDFQAHPNIVRTFGFVRDHDGSTLRVEERAQYGNLQTLLRSGEFRPTAQVLMAIFIQIIDAMMYILEQNLVHCDLRCSNILVFAMHPTDPTRNRVKLTNFSLAYRKTPSEYDDRRIPFSIRHCAPEIFRVAGRTNYTEASEVYSMGVLMWEACSQGLEPYASCETTTEIRERRIKDGMLPKPSHYQHYFWDNMLECWRITPEIRDSFVDMRTRLLDINFK